MICDGLTTGKLAGATVHIRFESRMVNWRAGQDETANTYVLAIAV